MTSNSANLGYEEQLTIMCSSLNACILFAVRVFYQVFLHDTEVENNVTFTCHKHNQKHCMP